MMNLDTDLAGVLGVLREAQTGVERVIDSIPPEEKLTDRAEARRFLLSSRLSIESAVGVLVGENWHALWDLTVNLGPSWERS